VSDLANSCEYLNIDKTCAAFSDNTKTKTNRQLKCKNNQNPTAACCCYLCIFKPQCDISCNYLGQSENHTKQDNITKDTYAHSEKFKTETQKFEQVPVAFCFSCNIPMASAKTQFAVDNWKDHPSISASSKVLPVTVLLCPNCGKIEFKAYTIRKEENETYGSS
jgi:hypothetical protein